AARWTKDSVLIGPSERYDLALVANNPGVWMVHCHMEHHMANGMMTVIAYEGYKPTGPIADFYSTATADATPAVPSHDGGGAMPPDMAMDAPTAAASAPATSTTPADATTGPTIAVAMVDDRFVPNALTVAAGTTVVWTNKGQDWHSIASFDGSFE